ncbi:MAG: CRISPR-associated protein Cas4 [Thermoanaerobacter sp.]|jgi:CRISPR-associated exonuclease Cas4|nr:CRISPR-associated protein Cas4 [Thermoanaerobacter sp.]MDK2793205.1 CRISPR-associated exonuclease Cas4 [Deferribacteres bacterium]
MDNNIIITGTKIAYYNICHRKLWFFSKNISMEHTSELVEIGKTIHENSYKRKKKEIELEGIKIDFFDKNKGIIHEVKKSKQIEKSHIWQLKFYLLHFKKIGLELTGVINYPLLRRTQKIELLNTDEEEIAKIMNHIIDIVSCDRPPEIIKKPYCKKCSYFELCYS